MKLQTINPATGEVLQSFDEIGDADLDRALERAQQTFRTYRRTSFAERSGWLHQAASIATAATPAARRLLRIRDPTHLSD